jgi:hypothetical protein
MTDVPESITIDWIGRHLVELRDEMRAFRDETRQDVQQLKDEAFVLTALMQRLDHKLDRLARRVDALEAR